MAVRVEPQAMTETRFADELILGPNLAIKLEIMSVTRGRKAAGGNGLLLLPKPNVFACRITEMACPYWNRKSFKFTLARTRA